MPKQANPSFFIITIRLFVCTSGHWNAFGNLYLIADFIGCCGFVQRQSSAVTMSCSLLHSQERSRVERIKKRTFFSFKAVKVAWCQEQWSGIIRCVHHANIFRGILYKLSRKLQFLYCDNQVLKIDTRNTDFIIQWKFFSPNTAKPIPSCWLLYIVKQIAYADTKPLEWLITNTYCNQLYETLSANQWQKSSL